MVSAEVTSCVRESIDAEIAPRYSQLREDVQRILNGLAAKGLHRSGQELFERRRIACDELGVRAAIIWQLIMRCHDTFGLPGDDSLLTDLRLQITDAFSAQADMVRRIASPRS